MLAGGAEIMPILPEERVGTYLEIKGRKVEYSSWPVARTTRRYGIQSRIFATNPWGVIRRAVNDRCSAIAKAQALAFRDQAEDFFTASANAGLLAAKPLLLYYCLMNIAKTYVLTVGDRQSYAAAYHGLRDKVSPGGQELVDRYLEAEPSGVQPKVFDDFLKAVSGSGLTVSVNYGLPCLLPQAVQGHRLWAAATGEKERFIALDEVSIMQDKAAKILWLRLELYEDNLSRLGISHSCLLDDSRLGTSFTEVKGCERTGRKVLFFQQNDPVTYTHRPSDKLQQLVDGLRPLIWTNVMSVPPYRNHYIYMAPLHEHNNVLPQLLSIYALFYYFGSNTRYRPEKFAQIMTGRHGAQIEEMISTLPNQFIYLMASHFMKQDVTRAADV
jgi:hypothetical protein